MTRAPLLDSWGLRGFPSTKPSGNCKFCGLPLKAIGKERKNGKNHEDWCTRDLHKKCWKEEERFNSLKKYIQYINDE
jgi:hypothetical protein